MRVIAKGFATLTKVFERSAMIDFHLPGKNRHMKCPISTRMRDWAERIRFFKNFIFK